MLRYALAFCAALFAGNVQAADLPFGGSGPAATDLISLSKSFGRAGKTPHQINAQKWERIMANERKVIQGSSEIGGALTRIRENCIAGRATALEENFDTFKIKGDVFCREAIDFSLRAHQLGSRNQNDLLEPYRNIAGRIGRGNNDAGAIGVLNEINQKSQGNATRDPIIISGPRGQFAIAPFGSLDAGFTLVALRLLRGETLAADVTPLAEDRLARGASICAYNTNQARHDRCQYSGESSALTAFNKKIQAQSR
ncbi:MAG: hypothetical protein ACK5X3_04450 [Pseudomonadota bacterium]|jgi:hypothetical protein